MKTKNFKMRLSVLLAAVMIFAFNSVAFAAEPETVSKEKKFGDVLYSDDGVVVFYGNPNDNEVVAEEIEAKANRSLRHDQAWVDAYTSAYKTIKIAASSSNPITYYTVRQESAGGVEKSTISVLRPDGTTTFIWDMGSGYKEVADRVVGASNNTSAAIAWTYGYLTLNWNVETNGAGARMNLWVW